MVDQKGVLCFVGSQGSFGVREDQNSKWLCYSFLFEKGGKSLGLLKTRKVKAEKVIMYREKITRRDFVKDLQLYSTDLLILTFWDGDFSCMIESIYNYEGRSFSINIAHNRGNDCF